jgi:hypothetical protein
MARMNANPLMFVPGSAVSTGSNHVMVRERGTPHSAGVGAVAVAGASADAATPADVGAGTDAAPVTAHPLSDHMISSRN